MKRHLDYVFFADCLSAFPLLSSPHDSEEHSFDRRVLAVGLQDLTEADHSGAVAQGPQVRVLADGGDSSELLRGHQGVLYVSVAVAQQSAGVLEDTHFCAGGSTLFAGVVVRRVVSGVRQASQQESS